MSDLEARIEGTRWSERSVYGAFLVQTYYYVLHSTRLLALAASRFTRAEEPIHRRMLRHASEEMSHEVLALRDAQALGFTPDDVEEFPATRAFYQTQYYMIEHVSPWSFWGYILMLEGLAVIKGPWLFATLRQLHGDRAASFVKVHAAEDVEHIAEAEKAMRLLPEAARPLVLDQIAVSSHHYGAMLDACGHFVPRLEPGAPL